jgi:hypothetical protein
MTAPSPLAGEGGEVLPRNGMGEGYASAARYPSPAPRCCKAAAALSRKGRATVLEVKRFAMVGGPGGLH